MTVSSTVNTSPIYAGNDTTGPWAFSFKTFDQAELEVIKASSAGVETILTLTTEYTVSLNGDQNASPGGEVTTVANVATGESLRVRWVGIPTQETDIQNAGGFYPEVIENALDKLTMLTQRNTEEVGRAVKTTITSGDDPDALVASLLAAEVNAAASEAAAAVSAGNAATSETNAAASAGAASTSAGNASTSESNAAASAGAASTSAGNASTSESNAAASAGAASTSAGNASTSESNAAASYDAFDDRYLGSKASDPTLDNDGNPLLTGALHWNTTSSALKVYNGSAWVAYGAAAPTFPAGTLMLFQQTAAPTGWTKETTHNDKALRVVTGTATSGGTSAFTTVFGKTATDAHTLTTGQIPAHTHSLNLTFYNPGSAYNAHYSSGSDSLGGTTAVSVASGGGSGGSHSHNMDIRVQYVDLIIASKDA